MRRKIGALLAGVLLVAGLAVPANAASASKARLLTPDFYPFAVQTGEMKDETAKAYIVEFKSPSVIMGGSASRIQTEKNAFRAKAKAEGINLQVTNEYSEVLNGMAVKATPAQIARIARMDGVLSISPVHTYSIPDQVVTDAAEKDMATAIAQTGADYAQSELGLSGNGVRVAVMDTGIDFNHPDLGGCFGPGCRVAYGYDLVGDDYDANPGNAATYQPVPHPDAIPDDCAGHGTHVAGIIGANGVVKGVAPQVTFGAYRVFGCNGSTDDAVMIAAMEMARRDKMQILNMSIGSAFSWGQSPTGKAASLLAKKGMVVVASIGNSGADGLYSAGAPGLGEDVIGVASMENTMVKLSTFTVGGTSYGYQNASAAPNAPTMGTGDLATITNTIGCTGSGGITEDLTGKVVLVKRGSCTFYEKAANAQAKGAVGVILYNNGAGRISPTVAGPITITIPVVSITKTDGEALAVAVAAGPTTMTWTDVNGSFANPGANMASSFTSYGLSPDLTLKPDVAAPGGNIYSTYPLELGGYATLSGTSMASPHTAGAVALLLQAKPKTTSAEVRDMLQNSAVPQLWSLNPLSGELDSAVRQGAGMIRIDKTIEATTSITPGKLSLGESEKGPKKVTLSIKNKSADTVTYSFDYVDAVTPAGNTFAPGFFGGVDSNIQFDRNSVKLKPNQTAKVTVTISPDSGLPTGSIYNGYILVTPDKNGPVMRVPYAGYVGDYQKITVLTPTANGFPWLAYLDGPSYAKVTTSHAYSMSGEDVAYFLLHMDHQSAALRAEVVDSRGKTLGLAFPENTYIERNQTAGSFYSWAWDGYVYGTNGKAKAAANGNYKVVIKVLKANGDKNNRAHWETFTTPTITIDRSLVNGLVQP